MRKTCGDCGRPFEAKRAVAKWCSDLCRKRAQRRPGGASRPRAVPGPRAGADAQPPEMPPGPVERKVRQDIASLVTAHPMGEALTEMSYALARMLDTGAALAAASVNRELRANLAELSRLAVDDGDELADELSEPELPPETRHPEEP